MASSILTPHKSCNLIPPMRGTRQNWNLVWQGTLWQPHRPHDLPTHPRWCRIDPGLGAATTKVPAASREDSRPQTILKFQPRNSFEYRVRCEPKLCLIDSCLYFFAFSSSLRLNSMFSLFSYSFSGKKADKFCMISKEQGFIWNSMFFKPQSR